MPQTGRVEPFVWVFARETLSGAPDELAVLSPAERRRLAASPAGAAADFLTGRVLLRRLAAAELEIAPHEVPLVAVCPECGGPHGRPRIEGSELRVSLAHCSAGTVAVAGWGREIGVDVEAVADAARSEGAIREVAGGSGLAHWTRVEATLKADGRGLRVDPREVRIRSVGGRPMARVGDRATRYRLYEPLVDPAVQLTVALAIGR